MTTTTYYNLNIVEGTDIVNPLTVDNPNYEKIDETMHNNAVAGVTLATEIANATVHAITRENSDCAVIRFIATSRWKAGDTATVDGVPVTALLPSGETLPDGAYVINANVLCILTGTNLTVYLEGKKVENASDIKYNDTNVGNELDELNTSVGQINGNIEQINSNLNVRYSSEDDYIYINGKKWKRAYLNSLVILDNNGFSNGFALGNGINVNSGFNSEGVLSFNASTKEIYGNMPTAQYNSRCNMISGAIDASNYNTISMKYRNSNGTYTLSGDISSYDTLYIGVALFNYPDDGNHVIALYLETSQTPGYLTDGGVYTGGIANKNVGTGTFYITDIWLY